MRGKNGEGWGLAKFGVKMANDKVVSATSAAEWVP